MGDIVVQWQELNKQFCLLLEIFPVGESSESLQSRCEPPHCKPQTTDQRLFFKLLFIFLLLMVCSPLWVHRPKAETTVQTQQLAAMKQRTFTCLLLSRQRNVRKSCLVILMTSLILFHQLYVVSHSNILSQFTQLPQKDTLGEIKRENTGSQLPFLLWQKKIIPFRVLCFLPGKTTQSFLKKQ